MSKKQTIDKRNIVKAAIAIAALVLVLASVAILEKHQSKNQPDSIDTDPINHTLQTVLIIGVDDEKQHIEDTYINQQQADFLLLLIINPSTKELSALQINRDTITPVTILGVTGQKVTKEPMQIALSHTYGTGGKDSAVNTVSAVEDLLNIDIDHYACAAMDVVKELNDAIGGVTLTPTTDINDDIKAGQEITLKGDQALTYIRARQNVADGSNLSRMERQRQYINAAIEKLNNTENPIKDNISESEKHSILKNVISDCSVERLETIFDQSTTFTFTGIKTLKGEAKVSDDGYMEYHLDEQNLQQTIEELFYK